VRVYLILFSVCLVAFLGTVNGPAFSQLRVGNVGCDSTKSTADALECINQSRRRVQDMLNDTYKLVAEAQDSEEKRSRLGAAQQSWIAYRDAQCAWESSLPDNPSLSRIYELSCVAAMTDLRAQLLSSIHAREAAEGPREFGAQPRWMNVLADESPDVFWRYGGWLRADMNCDGRDEYIMTGLALAQVQAAAAVRENAEQSTMRHEADFIVAIASNPETGRPRATLIKLPVDPAQEGPHLCRSRAELTVIEPPAADPEALEASPETSRNGGDKTRACNRMLRVSDRICPPVTISWDGRAYQVQQELSPAAENDANN